MSGNRLELPAEIENVPISNSLRCFRHIHFSGNEKILCLSDPYRGDILISCHADRLLKEHPKMAGTAMRHLRQFLHRKTSSVITLNILPDRLDDFIMR